MDLRRLFINKTNNTSIHLMRSILSSAFAFAVDFSILTVLVEVAGVHYLISATIGFVVGTTITYLFSISWIFKNRTLKNAKLEYGLYIGIGVAGVLLHDLFIWFFTDIAGIHYMISKMISGSTVFFFNFLARRFLLFR